MNSPVAERIRNVIAAMLIVAVVVTCYANSTKGAFVLDDDERIVSNMVFKGFDDETRTLMQNLSAVAAQEPFRAFSSITLGLNYKYAERYKDANGKETGLSPYGFHVVNICVHALAAVLAFFVVRKIVKIYRGGAAAWTAYFFPALIAALLFAACPMNTQAVTYIVQRDESLCSMPILAALLCFLYAREWQIGHYDKREEPDKTKKKRQAPPPVRRETFAWVLAFMPALVLLYKIIALAAPEAASIVTLVIWAICVLGIITLALFFPRRIQWRGDILLGAAFVFFGLAAVTKQVAMVVPFLLLLIEVVVLRKARAGKPFWKYHAVFLATLAFAAVVFLLAAAFSQQNVQGAPPPEGASVSLPYFGEQVAGSVVLKYMGKLFLPLHLNIDPDIGFFGERPGDTLLNAEFAGLVLMILFAVVLYRYSRLAALGIFWFFLVLSPSASILKLNDPMAEHRAYLAGLGLFIVVGLALTEAVRLRATAAGRYAVAVLVVIGLVCILAVDVMKARERNETYRSAVTLWGDAVKNSPQKARPYDALGYEYLNRGAPAHADDLHSKLLNATAADDLAAIENKLEKALEDELAPNCALARLMLDTAEVYDQKDLWLPKILALPDFVTKDERFWRMDSSRIYNNQGVNYSNRSVAFSWRLTWRIDYVSAPASDAAPIMADMLHSQYAALKAYELAVMLNVNNLPAMVNSTRIHYTIAKQYYYWARKYKDDAAKRNMYLAYYEDELTKAENAIIAATLKDTDPHKMFTGQMMIAVEEEFARYLYDPSPHEQPEVEPNKTPEERKRQALKHWRYLKWLSYYNNRVPGDVDNALLELHNYTDSEPDPTAGFPRPLRK